MKRRVWKRKTTILLVFVMIGTGCSSDCAPIDDGGVIVDIVGASSCDGVTVAANDGARQYEFDSWPPPNTDGGMICSFRGLTGRTGTFTVSVSSGGSVVKSQSVTLERADACNFAGKSLEFDLSQP